MTDRVDDTLRLWRSTPFTWGGAVPHVPGHGDCLLSIGEYVAACGGPDLAAGFRGLYTTEAGALAHVDAAGGVVALIDRAALERIDTPARGDICVLDTGFCHVGALCTGDGIAARLERGVIEVSIKFARIVQAWKVPNE